MRLLLAAEDARLAAHRVEVARLLDHLAAAGAHLDLPPDFQGQRVLDVGEGVQVLDLGAASRARSLPRGRIETLTSQRSEPFLHVAVGDPEIEHDQAELPQVGARLRRSAQVGFETISRRGTPARLRSTRALGRLVGVDVLPRVLLEVDARQADPLASSPR